MTKVTLRSCKIVSNPIFRVIKSQSVDGYLETQSYVSLTQPFFVLAVNEI